MTVCPVVSCRSPDDYGAGRFSIFCCYRSTFLVNAIDHESSSRLNRFDSNRTIAVALVSIIAVAYSNNLRRKPTDLAVHVEQSVGCVSVS